MSVNLSPVAGAAAQFLDNSGNVLTGGKLYTYLAGTTTPAATYTSSTGTTFHSNPIILDAAGRVPNGGEIWLSDNVAYKFVLKDANDVLIGTWDNLVGINSNFVNYTSQEEIIVATAGQTVFNLSTVTYVPGTNSLQVFVDGVNQYDGVTYAYVETNATTVTFTAGLHVGALVKFTTAVSVSAGSTNANLVLYNEGDVGAVDRTVESKLQESVSVKDFGAVGNGVVDDTFAIQAAYASGAGAIYFPTGTYSLNAAIAIPAGVLTYGDGYSKSKIKCRNDLSNVVFFTLTGNTELRDVEIYGATTAIGTGVLFSGGTYTFSGHGKLNKCRVYNFAKGVDVNSWYELAINQTQITNCTVGLNATPPTNGGDNGYINCLYVTDSYFLSNGTYDVYFNPAVRISNVSFINTIFDPGAATASVYLNLANPISFENCYFEPTGVVQAINSSVSQYSLKDCYFVNSNEIYLTSTSNIVSIDSCRGVNIYANYILNQVTIINSNSVGTFVSSNGKNCFINSTVNSVYYGATGFNLTIGNGNTIQDITAFQKTITSTTVNANSTATLVADYLSSGVMAGFAVGIATISNKYYPGLILTVTPATTGNTSYFNVLATNTTSSPITVASATLNIIIQRMSTYTTI